ncbi:MAG: MFS transporter [Mucilaginibacter sp.]
MLTSFLQLFKQAYTGLSRNSWYLSVVMLINRAGTMVVPFMSIYCVKQLHFSIVQAGVVMSLFGIGAISGSFVGGKLTDKLGFYDIQVGSLLSGGFLFLLLGYQHTFLTVCLGIFALSFCNEAFRPANSTAIAHYSTPENKTRSYSLNRLAINLGWAVGSGFGGWLAAVNYHLLFWVDGCTNILAALLLLKIMPRAGIVNSIKKMEAGIAILSPYRDKVYMVFILLSTIFGMCFFQFFIMEPVFYKLEWHFSERFIGSLMALNGIIIGVVEMVLIHYLEGKRHLLIYIVSGVLLGALGFVLLIYLPASVAAALIVVLLMTFGEMLAMPFMNTFWMSRASEYNRGEYSALYSMSWSAAQVCAPVVGGVIISVGGFSLLWWALCGLSVVAAGGYYWLYRFTRN